ncbi:MAG: fused MFS/spermidine synthase [Desulfobacterales bacterium]
MPGTLTARRKSNLKTADDRPSSLFFLLILSCFFVSGLTGLTYQILWTRMIVKIIGSAPFAISIVLTVFMGGLGLGSYLAGRTIDRVKNPLTLVRIYGILEIIIALYGLVLPLLLIAFRPLYAYLYNHLFAYFFGYSLLTFFGCTILLLIPVTCMGATLPVLSRFFVTSISKVGTHVGRLYGLNTIGAAAGSLLCGFWMLSALGILGTLGLAITLNTIIGLICIAVSRGGATSRFQSTDSEVVSTPDSVNGSLEPPLIPIEKQKRYSLIIFAVSGFCAMAYEVIWVKLLGLLVGPTTYSFTIVLVTFIACLAFGSIFFGWLADRVRNTLFLLIATQLIAALSALFFSQIMGNSQIFFAKLIFHYKDNFVLLQFLKASSLFVFMFIPTFCLGATFPLVGKICTRSLEKTGHSIGFAYAINTVGAVLGSFCAGFLLIPFLGKEHSIGLVVSIQLLTPLFICLHIVVKTKSSVLKWSPLIAGVLAGLILIKDYPHWDRKMLSKGKYHRFDEIQKRKTGWLEALLNGTEIFSPAEAYELVYFGDGIGGFTTVLKSNPDAIGEVTYSLLNSGKADASSSRKDMFTQTLLAHFAMLYHEKPENVLVLGLASGITAGEVLFYPSVKRLDGIEINRQVVAASDFFIPWNNNVLADPRTELIIQDGRAHLELTKRKYDVIISEPSNPWMAGLATLFTHEFMNLAKNRLMEDGIYVQWLHSYQMDWPTFSLVGRTFSKVFPNSMLVTTDPRGELGPDFLLVGFKGKKQLDPRIAKSNLPHARKSNNMTLNDHNLFYNFIVSEDLTMLFDDGPINTDNNPILEFSAPKLIHYDPAVSLINKRLSANSWLSPETTAIIRKNRESIDSQLDFAAYTLSFNTHPKNMVDLARATPEQKERYNRMMIEYCSSNVVGDFSFIPDKSLRRKCIEANLEAIRKNLDKVPDKAPLYYYMGWLCHHNGLVDEAVDPLLEVLQTKPDDPETNHLLKKVLSESTARDENMMKIRKKRDANENNPGFHYHLGNLYLLKKMDSSAVDSFEKALGIRPDFIHALNSMALYYTEKNDYDRAISYFKQMVEVKPDIAAVYYNIACLYSKQNRIEKSIDWLNKAIKAGYDNWQLIQTDRDLKNIRSTTGYQRILDQQG